MSAEPRSDGVDLIGTGWRFPIRVTPRGGIAWSSGPDRIRDAIWIILSTAPGERIMRPYFGAGIHDHVFDPNSNVARSQLASAISEALARWEPRIGVVSIDVREGDEPRRVDIAIDYTIRTTNELFNLVYPLYLQEGAV